MPRIAGGAARGFDEGLPNGDERLGWTSATARCVVPQMQIPRRALALVTATLTVAAFAGAAPAQDTPPTPGLEKAGWTLITASDDTFVYMRPDAPARDGVRRAWTAYDSHKVLDRDGFKFRSVRSLGEFDCKRRVSRVVEEIYHDRPGLTGKSWHSPKFIATPWAPAQPDSVGAIRMAFACRALTDT